MMLGIATLSANLQIKRTCSVKRLLMTCLAWSFGIVRVASANEHPVAVIDQLDQPFDLNPYVEYIDDADHTLTYEKLQSGAYEHLWKRNTERHFIGRNQESRYWVQIQIRYQKDFSHFKPVLYIPNHPSLLGELTLWIPEANGSRQQFLVGHLQPFYNRDMASHQYAFNLSAHSDSYTILGSIDNGKTGNISQLPLLLLSQQLFELTDRQNRTFLIAFYAVMLAMLLYNGFLFFSLRQRVYGIYLLFLTAATLSCANIDGSTIRWLWSNHYQFNFRFTMVNGAIISLFYLMFVWETLDRLQFSPRLAKLFHYVFWFGLFIALHNSFTPFMNYANIATTQFGSLSMLIIIVAIIAAMRQHLPIANYLMIAEICTVTGGALFMLMLNGHLPINEFTFWSLHLGIMCEALLLSLAMAERTRLAQQQAIDHLQQYELLYEDSVEGLFEFNLLNNTLKCNNAMAKLFGFSSSEELIKGGNAEAHTSRLWTNQELIVPLFKQGFLTDFEIPLVSELTQEEIWVSATLRLINDERGTPYAVEGSMVDITERKLKEKAEQEKLVVIANNQARSKFFASMSHELRTPLTAILGYADAADNAQVEMEFIKTAANRIHRSGKQLLQIINDLLDLSKVEAQKLEVEQQPVLLLPLVEDVKETIDVLVDTTHQRFEVDYHFPLPKIITNDATRIKQVLINLCSNAIRQTASGQITLSIACEKELQFMRFTVQDSATSLTPEQLAHLFDVFNQAEDSTLRSYAASGLGLHLSKQLANKLGGDLTATTVIGTGNRFDFTVATDSLLNCEWLEQPPQNKKSSPAIDIVVPTLSGTVLYAEDNEDNQRLVKTIVERTGAEITIVSNGQRALELCAVKNFDLVLTDVRMPILDGVELTKRLLANNAALPVVAITATLLDSEIAELTSVGFKRILRKPIDRQVIYDVMQTYLPKPQAVKAPATNAIRVLLAEDNLDNQGLIALYLKKAHAQVEIVENGVEAIEKALTGDFDLILMDMQMPVMDGMTAVRSLRAQGYKKPIYALTANDSAEAIAECKHAGCDGHLSKPLNTARLTALIHMQTCP